MIDRVLHARQQAVRVGRETADRIRGDADCRQQRVPARCIRKCPRRADAGNQHRRADDQPTTPATSDLIHALAPRDAESIMRNRDHNANCNIFMAFGWKIAVPRQTS